MAYRPLPIQKQIELVQHLPFGETFHLQVNPTDGSIRLDRPPLLGLEDGCEQLGTLRVPADLLEASWEESAIKFYAPPAMQNLGKPKTTLLKRLGHLWLKTIDSHSIHIDPVVSQTQAVNTVVELLRMGYEVPIDRLKYYTSMSLAEAVNTARLTRDFPPYQQIVIFSLTNYVRSLFYLGQPVTFAPLQKVELNPLLSIPTSLKLWAQDLIYLDFVDPELYEDLLYVLKLCHLPYKLEQIKDRDLAVAIAYDYLTNP